MWVNAYRLLWGFLNHNSVLYREGVAWKAIEVPFLDLDWIAEDPIEDEVVLYGYTRNTNHFAPSLDRPLSELLSERTEVCDECGAHQDIALYRHESFVNHPVAHKPLLFLAAESVQQLAGPVLLHRALINLPLKNLHLLLYPAVLISDYVQVPLQLRDLVPFGLDLSLLLEELPL